MVRDWPAPTYRRPSASFFKEIRNTVPKTGETPLNRVPVEHWPAILRQQLSGVKTHVMALPEGNNADSTTLVDAVQASDAYFRSLVSLVFRRYERFKCVVDPRRYFTEAHFVAMGKTFADALAELGLPPVWEACMPDGCDGWRILRSRKELCPINDLFDEYVAKQISDPDREESRPFRPSLASDY